MQNNKLILLFLPMVVGLFLGSGGLWLGTGLFPITSDVGIFRDLLFALWAALMIDVVKSWLGLS